MPDFWHNSCSVSLVIRTLDVNKHMTISDKLTVLIVDENKGRSELLTQAILDAGHNVISALNSSHVLSDKVAELAPDIIIIFSRVSRISDHDTV